MSEIEPVDEEAPKFEDEPRFDVYVNTVEPDCDHDVLRTQQLSDEVNVDRWDGEIVGIEILNAHSLTVNGVDILEWNALLTRALHEMVTAWDDEAHPAAITTMDRAANAARALLGMDDVQS